MEAIIDNLSTIKELNEWAELWGMEQDDYVNLRRIELVSELANSLESGVYTELNAVRLVLFFL